PMAAIQRDLAATWATLVTEAAPGWGSRHEVGEISGKPYIIWQFLSVRFTNRNFLHENRSGNPRW
ncbi:MAG: hypothetical protein ACRC8N_12000, partial [Aeromonas veronii]